MPDVTITINGDRVTMPDGITVAAALIRHGVTGFRTDAVGHPRGPVCGMGVCFECRVEIDGRAHQRSCLLPIRAGMEVRTDG